MHSLLYSSVRKIFFSSPDWLNAGMCGEKTFVYSLIIFSISARVNACVFRHVCDIYECAADIWFIYKNSTLFCTHRPQNKMPCLVQYFQYVAVHRFRLHFFQFYYKI